MHDPMVVAHEVRLPIPRRLGPLRERGNRRWGVDVSRRTNPENLGQRTYQWWRPRGYTLRLAGRAYGLRHFVTVWHVEPDERDSGEVCKHWRVRGGKRVPDYRWKWHVHHWKLQWHQGQALRRWLLTRCEWCGGPSRTGARVNCSHQWDREPGQWWRGETGLFHAECSSVETASRSCVCDAPVLDHHSYGNCARCTGFRGYGRTPAELRATAVLRRCPSGQKPSRALIEEANRVREEITA